MKLLRGSDILPLLKGDIIISRHSYQILHGGTDEFYSATRVGKGGRNPREESGGPIDIWSVTCVIRPGWPLSGLVFGDTEEECIRKAREAAKDEH